MRYIGLMLILICTVLLISCSTAQTTDTQSFPASTSATASATVATKTYTPSPVPPTSSQTPTLTPPVVSTPSFASKIIDPIDALLWNNPLCHLPCWNNILPGKSTQEEVISILEELTFLENIEIHEWAVHWTFPNSDDIMLNGVSADCRQAKNSNCVIITFFDNKVIAISFPSELSYEDFVALYGNPDTVMHYFGYGLDGNLREACNVGLLWKNIKAIAIFEADEENSESKINCNLVKASGKVSRRFNISRIVVYDQWPDMRVRKSSISEFPWSGFFDD